MTTSGLRMSGRCPPPGITSSRALGIAATMLSASATGTGASASPWTTSVGQLTPPRRRAGTRPVELGFLGRDHRRRRLEADRDHLGDEIVGVGLVEDRVHEGHDESGPVGPPGVEACWVRPRWIGSEVHVRGDDGDAVEALSVVGSEEHDRVQSPGCGDERCALDSDCVEDRECVRGVERKVVAAFRPVAVARSARVVRENGRARLECGDLMPDDARVDEVPRRHEQNRAPTPAVEVPGDTRPVCAHRGSALSTAGSGDHARKIQRWWRGYACSGASSRSSRFARSSSGSPSRRSLRITIVSAAIHAVPSTA